MISLLEFLIDSNTKIEVDVDNLTHNKKPEILYSDRWDFEDDNDMDIQWEDCKVELGSINQDCKTGFLCTKFNSLGKSKSIRGGYDPDNDIYTITDDLDEIIDKVITGNDYGYEVRLVGGHLELECINSGSSATYYIYQLEAKAWDNIELWWQGDETVDNLKFLYNDKAIIPIKS